jgi:cobalt-zinc-cadmium efflux system membrane fusion protein
MLVRGMLEIPPAPGWTVVPRTALVVDDYLFYVFVKLAGQDDKFERRQVRIAQEKDDHAVIEEGLREGDEVVSVGGLLLAQLYEDMKTTQAGAPTGEGPGVDER